MHLVVEMIFINLLECQRRQLERSTNGLEAVHVSCRASDFTLLIYPHCFQWVQVCYVAFWDEITLSAQELGGHRIGEDGFIGRWRIVVVRELPFTDQRLNGKIPKVGSRIIGWLRDCLNQRQDTQIIICENGF